MGNLRYRSGSISKSYELKDSSAKPRLAIRTSSGTKYLTLKAGVRSGELGVRGASTNYYVKTWGQDIPEFWRGMSPEEPFRGMGANRGDTSHGGIGIWILVNEENYPVVIFGRIGADRPDSWARATWYANRAGTADVTKWPNNFTLTQEQLQHPKRLKENIRLATITSAAHASTSNLGATLDGDWNSTKNYIRMSDIITSLTTKSSYIGYTHWQASTSAMNYRVTGYGYNQINTRGVYFPDGTEEKMGLSNTYGGASGIDSEGFKVTSYVYQTIRGVGSNLNACTNDYYSLYTGISSSSDHSGAPYIDMSTNGRDSTGNTLGNWAQRDFYIEFPYAWGEDTNPNDYFTFTPKQILNAALAIATEKGVADHSYGFTRGYNY